MPSPLGALGKYKLLDEIGSGGFGTVYRAEETVLGVVRAAKVLHAPLAADPQFNERFRREARIAAQLEHPHIVPVYDFGESDGRWYLAAMYMSGGSLKYILKRGGPLSFDRALDILQQIAAALDFAHNQPERLIHRDVKPSNILFDETGKAYLADFGFAKALSGTNSASLSSSGEMVGTPHYMPPEIWRGQEISPASDVYSLTCVFYEMLTGQLLFPGDSPPEVMTKHLLDGPQFSAQWPTRVPISVVAVMKRVLAKESHDRWRKAGELANALAGLRVAPVTGSKEGELPQSDVDKSQREVTETDEYGRRATRQEAQQLPPEELHQSTPQQQTAYWPAVFVGLLIMSVVTTASLAGLIVAWFIYPNEIAGASPEGLSDFQKVEWLSLAADSFAVTGDIDGVRRNIAMRTDIYKPALSLALEKTSGPEYLRLSQLAAVIPGDTLDIPVDSGIVTRLSRASEATLGFTSVAGIAFVGFLFARRLTGRKLTMSSWFVQVSFASWGLL